MALGGEKAEAGWWRTLVESRSRTGEEYGGCWRSLQREGEQICNFLNVEFDGAIAKGVANAEGLREGASCRQIVTEQREEWREALLAEALKQHGDQAARPVLAYPQFDKLSTAWKLALPGPTMGPVQPCLQGGDGTALVPPFSGLLLSCWSEGRRHWGGRLVWGRDCDCDPPTGHMEDKT